MRKKYDLGAARPWVSVPPDPPRPVPDDDRHTRAQWAEATGRVSLASQRPPGGAICWMKTSPKLIRKPWKAAYPDAIDQDAAIAREERLSGARSD